MYSRNVTFKLKAKGATEFTSTLEGVDSLIIQPFRIQCHKNSQNAGPRLQ